MSNNTKEHTLRRGLQALYSFTPFKVRRTDPYSLLLIPAGYLDTEPEIRQAYRTSASKDEFDVSLPEMGIEKHIRQPYRLYPQTFSEEGNNHYIYRRRGYEDPDNWNYPPMYMEFDYTTLRNCYFCQHGWIISSRSEECPMFRHCPVAEDSPCRYYRGPEPFTRLYNIYPEIKNKFSDPPSAGAFEPILAIRHEDEPLASVNFTESGKYKAFINSISFTPQNPLIYETTSIFTDISEGLGFRLSKVNAIELNFEEENLKEMILDKLADSESIPGWVSMKYYLYQRPDQNGAEIRERRGIGAFDTMNDEVENSVEAVERGNESLINQVEGVDFSENENALDFATVVFMHSFAHALRESLVTKYGCSKNHIYYYLDHPRLRTVGTPSGKTRVVLFETAIGGFGYLKDFKEDLRNEGEEVLLDLLQKVLAGNNRHRDRISNNYSNLSDNLDSVRNDYPEITEFIEEAYLNTFSSSNIYPHTNSVRRVVAQEMGITDEEQHGIIDDIFQIAGISCWDGCQSCVIEETSCNFLPYDQPFLVSNQLLCETLESLSNNIRIPVHSDDMKKGVTEVFNCFKNFAEQEIYMIAPWISPEIVEALKDTSSEKNINVQIITKKDPDNDTQMESLEKLSKICNQSSIFSCKILDELHAKGMNVDNVCVLKGSFNFTWSGLNANIENVTYDFSVEGTNNFSKKFEALWNSDEARQIPEIKADR